jgi:hypothetical protein
MRVRHAQCAFLDGFHFLQHRCQLPCTSCAGISEDPCHGGNIPAGTRNALKARPALSLGDVVTSQQHSGPIADLCWTAPAPIAAVAFTVHHNSDRRARACPALAAPRSQSFHKPSNRRASIRAYLAVFCTFRWPRYAASERVSSPIFTNRKPVPWRRRCGWMS